MHQLSIVWKIAITLVAFLVAIWIASAVFQTFFGHSYPAWTMVAALLIVFAARIPAMARQIEPVAIQSSLVDGARELGGHGWRRAMDALECRQPSPTFSGW